MEFVFETVRLLFVSVFFIYLSWLDYRAREVDNKYWVLATPIFFGLTMLQICLFSPELLLMYLACIIISSALALGMFYMAGFGGADAKALIVLAIAMPFSPKILSGLIIMPSIFSKFFFPLTVLLNATLMELLLAVYFLLKNLAKIVRHESIFREYKLPLWKKPLLMLTGYRTAISKLEKTKFAYPLEKPEQTGIIVRLMPDYEKRNERLEQLKQAKGAEAEVWATPGLPFLIFMTAGMFLSLFFDVFAVFFQLFGVTF